MHEATLFKFGRWLECGRFTHTGEKFTPERRGMRHVTFYKILNPFYISGRDRPKFGFGCGFGAETDLKCSFGYGSDTPFHIRFRPQLYGRRPKLE